MRDQDYHDGRKKAVARKLGIEELLTRPLSPDVDPRRYARSMPGMKQWLTLHFDDRYLNDLKIGNFDQRLAAKNKSNPVRRA